MSDEPNTNMGAKAARSGEPGIFGLVVEMKDSGPILWEAEAAQSSYGAMRDRFDDMKRNPRVIRLAIVRITFEYGNELALADMKGLQNV